MPDLCTPRGGCRYCVVHEVAWLAQPWYGRPTWHPVPRGMLKLAIGLAQAAGCGDWITVEVVACDQCQQEAQEAS
jgi:hypothetical protein